MSVMSWQVTLKVSISASCQALTEARSRWKKPLHPIVWKPELAMEDEFPESIMLKDDLAVILNSIYPISLK